MNKDQDFKRRAMAAEEWAFSLCQLSDYLSDPRLTLFTKYFERSSAIGQILPGGKLRIFSDTNANESMAKQEPQVVLLPIFTEDKEYIVNDQDLSTFTTNNIFQAAMYFEEYNVIAFHGKSSLSRAGKALVLAHELFHFFEHKNRISSGNTNYDYWREEALANIFELELLSKLIGGKYELFLSKVNSLSNATELLNSDKFRQIIETNLGVVLEEELHLWREVVWRHSLFLTFPGNKEMRIDALARHLKEEKNNQSLV